MLSACSGIVAACSCNNKMLLLVGSCVNALSTLKSVCIYTVCIAGSCTKSSAPGMVTVTYCKVSVLEWSFNLGYCYSGRLCNQIIWKRFIVTFVLNVLVSLYHRGYVAMLSLFYNKQWMIESEVWMKILYFCPQIKELLARVQVCILAKDLLYTFPWLLKS